ncbi:Retrotrans gag domain-containing protein [Abeliophyllum distichum]|uniref:Retrotrans gag domain-containing protein n=1 Tax=Abeliophyllum distichum TaxID=126358 RepID=A0ABD1NZA5_9LAMI
MTEIPQTAEVKIPPVVENPQAVEVSPSETMQTQEMTSTSRNSIPANWENILNEKVDEAITQRKNRRRPISIKGDPFTEEVMNVALLLKSKEPMGDFDGTTDPIDHLRLFQDRVRLHGWPDAIDCRAFPMTLRKDAREWFDTLPPRSILSFLDFTNKFAICFSSSARKKKTSMGLMHILQEKGESLREYIS